MVYIYLHFWGMQPTDPNISNPNLLGHPEICQKNIRQHEVNVEEVESGKLIWV